MTDTATMMVSIAPPPLAEGETYIALLSDSDKRPYHIILLPGDNGHDPRTAQLEWAKSIGGDLPNRIEQAILWANFRTQFKQAWYWSGEQHEKEPGWAWCQSFDDGSQDYGPDRYEFRARAVRRVYVKEAA